LSVAQKQKQYDEIKNIWKDARGLSDDKVQLAVQTYEVVDKHIRRLDADLARFEAELKQKLMANKTENDNNSKSEKSNKGTAAGKKKAATPMQGLKGKKRLALTNEKSKSSHKKKKKMAPDDTPIKSSPDFAPSALARLSGTALIQSLAGASGDVLDMPVDPNEPTYCLCQQVSYGEMIGCDNSECTIEWFHFGCVGLTNKPKGKWLCPRCQEDKKKKTGNLGNLDKRPVHHFCVPMF